MEETDTVRSGQFNISSICNGACKFNYTNLGILLLYQLSVNQLNLQCYWSTPTEQSRNWLNNNYCCFPCQGKQETHKHQTISGGSAIHQTWQVSQSFSLSAVSWLVYHYLYNNLITLKNDYSVPLEIEFNLEKFAWSKLVGVKICWEHPCLCKIGW